VELNNSANTITNYLLKSGFLTFAAGQPSLGNAPGNLVQDYMVFDGGGIVMAATSFVHGDDAWDYDRCGMGPISGRRVRRTSIWCARQSWARTAVR
jgi:hypothetical protein